MRTAIVLGLALGACASAAPRLEVLRTNLLAEPAPPAPEGTCPATMRVRVVDATGAPVPSAEVTVHQRVSMNAPSMVPMRSDYHTEPVFTNTLGEARVCHPDRVPKQTEDYFTHRDGGHVEAKLGERAGVLASPFKGPVVIRP